MAQMSFLTELMALAKMPLLSEYMALAKDVLLVRVHGSMAKMSYPVLNERPAYLNEFKRQKNYFNEGE